MMTGAAPAKTQQLLDKSLIQKSSARGLICVKGNSNSSNHTTSKFRRISFHQEVDQLFFKFFVLLNSFSVFIIMSVLLHISDDKKLVVAGEREHAIALYMACKYLPPQLLASPGERKGMLIEASTLLEKIGDRKSLEACSKLMRSFGAASVQA